MGPDPEPARRPEYQRATFACSRYERSVPRHVLACGELGDQSYRRAVEPFRHHFGGVAAAHGAGVSASLRDTLEALHAEIEDRKLHRRQPGDATRDHTECHTVAAAFPQPVLKCHSGNGSRRRANRACSGPFGTRWQHSSRGGGRHRPRDRRRFAPDHLRSFRHHQAARYRARSRHLPRNRRRSSRSGKRPEQRGPTRLHVHRRIPGSVGSPGPPRSVKTVLLVSTSDALRPRLLRALEDTSVFTAATDEEALRTLRLTEMELILKEAAPPFRNLSAFITRVRHLVPTAVIVCVLGPGAVPSDDEGAAEAADFVLLQPFTSRHLQSVLKQAEDKLRLLQEVAALRASRRPMTESGHDEPAPSPTASAHALTQMVKEFAKALAAGFDLPRVLDQFLDGVAELVRPGRAAILLADGETRHYRVRAYRGLAPHVVDSLTLAADSGLPLWLATEGRLIQLEEAQSRLADPASREIARELAVLQSIVAIPLSSHGELVGILTLGQRISGGGYGRGETETLFNLGTHLATAIREIRVHHLLQYEKEFNERILARMSSGVITIDPDEKVVAINRRAEEILGMPARDVLHYDLRVLPSPLGDMLFEALSKGRPVARTEVQLALRNLPLEVSTYPVMGDHTEPMGAVLVFEDLTAQRQLAQERRGAEQLQLLTQVVARIADEIKNPLVSINAFMELIGERYDDATFRNQFSSVVGRDVRRLVQIFDK